MRVTRSEKALTQQRSARDEKIRDLWSKGLNRSVIAERLGLSRDTVSGVLKRMGLTTNKDKRL
jgi:hypothetical protein